MAAFDAQQNLEDAVDDVVHTTSWMPLLIPGLDAIDLAGGVARLRQIATDEARDPATLPIRPTTPTS
jgi:hypothetical protein